MALRCTPPAKVREKVLSPPCSVSVQSPSPTKEPPVKVLSFPRSTLSLLKDLSHHLFFLQFIWSLSFAPALDFVYATDSPPLEPAYRLSFQNGPRVRSYPTLASKYPEKDRPIALPPPVGADTFLRRQKPAIRLTVLEADCTAAYCK